MKKIGVLIVACAAVLAGCATEYHPLDREGGYSEQALAPGLWHVKITHSAYTMPSQVQDFSLLRSAELTLQQGYKSFTLAAPDSEAVLLQGGSAQTAPPGPDLLVRMSRRQADGSAVVYDARKVCDKLAAYYGLECAAPKAKQVAEN